MNSNTVTSDILQASLTGEVGGEIAEAFDAARERGNTYFRRGDYELALSAYTEAETLNPLSPIPPSNRALVYLKQQRWQQAREQSAIALQLLEEFPLSNGNDDSKWADNLKVKLLLRRSTACEKLHMYQLSADDLAQALHLQPDNTQVRRNLESLKRDHGVTSAPRRQGGVTRTLGKTKIREIGEIRGNGEHAHTHTQANGNTKISGETQRLEESSGSQQIRRLNATVLQSLTDKMCTRPPENTAEFEHAWRTLCSAGDDKAYVRGGRYLIRTVGADAIRRGLLGENLTPQMLVQVGRSLLLVMQDEHVMSDRMHDDIVVQKEIVVNILKALQMTPRFHLLVMFLSQDEKLVFKNLIDTLYQLPNERPNIDYSSLRQTFLVDEKMN